MSDDKAAHVIDALSRVIAELPAIGKDGRADPKQGGYAYRGIEQITQHVQPLFAKHGVVFVPHVRDWEIRELLVNNKPWTDTVELIEYTVYGPGGVDDHITVGPILAIGRDNSDKGANKCMTQAFKYALLQALAISDAKDDGDQASVEADATHAPPVELPPGDSVGVVKTRLVEGLEHLGVPDPKAAAAEVWTRADLALTKVETADGERDWVSPAEQEVLQAVTDEWLTEQEAVTA